MQKSCWKKRRRENEGIWDTSVDSVEKTEVLAQGPSIIDTWIVKLRRETAPREEELSLAFDIDTRRSRRCENQDGKLKTDGREWQKKPLAELMQVF